jgi:outer membrane protein insertion porin family
MRTEMLKWDRELDSFDKDTIGGGVTFGYPIFDYTRFYSGYSYEVNKIHNITSEAASIQDLEGTNVTRGITNTIRYDSRDRAHNAQPTEGANHSFSVENTGGFLGGEVSFAKYLANAGFYQSLPFGFIAYAHGVYGYVQKNSSGILPDYEKFYLGGSNSVRGFDSQGIYIEDEDGQKVGAEQKLQFNFELLHPLFGMEGLLGMVYHDLGQVYSKEDSIDFDALNSMRRGWGFGIKWFSPIGPIRCEYSYIIDPQMEESGSGRFDFNMGGSF